MKTDKELDPNESKLERVQQEVAAIVTAESMATNNNQVTTCRQDDLRFPESIMTGVAGDFANLYGHYLESPKEFFFMSFLTCEGNILSPFLTTQTEITPQPRFYTILLGESADDRKSTAIMKSVNFFNEYFPDHFKQCSGVGSAEGLQKKLATTEGKGLLLCFDEFKQLVNKCRIDGSVLLPCVTILFEANRYESQTKKGGIEIEKAHLSILAASTIQTYQNIWLPQFTDIGFNNRLFLVPGTAGKKIAFPEKIPKIEKTRISNRLRAIIRTARSGKELKISPCAKSIFENWYQGIERSIFSKRLDTYAHRFMALFAINDNKKEIDEETIEKVIQLCNWQLIVRRLHDPIDAENTIARMEENIRRLINTKGALTERELRQRANAARYGLWAFNTAIRNLQNAKDIQLISSREKRWGIGV